MGKCQNVLNSYILFSSSKILCLQNMHWVQGVQAFAFCVVTVNDEHTKPRFKWKSHMQRTLLKALVLKRMVYL